MTTANKASVARRKCHGRKYPICGDATAMANPMRHVHVANFIKNYLAIDNKKLPIYTDDMKNELDYISDSADRLAEFFDMEFGGKKSGRYRMPGKFLRELMQRRRLYEDDIRDLGRALLERGFVLIDMDSFYVVTSANAFVNYRRANEDLL